MQTRRYPRTMQDAFGPYTDNTLYEPQTHVEWPWLLVGGHSVCLALMLVAAAAAAVMVFGA